MKTKEISLFYRVTSTAINPPPEKALARKDDWLREIQRSGAAQKRGVVVRVTYRLFNPDIARISRYFNGPVVEYWIIQSNDLLDGEIPRTLHDRARETLLSNMLGYDVQLLDRTERRRKSTADFLSVQKWNDFLETLRETEFEPNGYEMPDSEAYWKIAEKYGEDQAKVIAIEQLRKRLRAKLSPPGDNVGAPT